MVLAIPRTQCCLLNNLTMGLHPHKTFGADFFGQKPDGKGAEVIRPSGFGSSTREEC